MVAKYYTTRRKKDKPSGEVIFRIGVITDTHLRAGVDGNPTAPGAISGNRIHYAANSKVRDFVNKVAEMSADLDFAVHLGDACDHPSDWPFFKAEWAEVELPKVFVVGNHDVDDLGYEQLLKEVGYEDNVEYGGSKFNQYYDFDGVRIIFLDSQYDENGEHTTNSRSRIMPAGVSWLGSMLLSTSGHALVFSHNIPHYRAYPGPANPYFPNDVAADIQSVISSALATNSNLKSVNWFGGHAHTPNVVKYNNLGRCTGYRLCDSIERWDDNENSVKGMSVLELYSNGVMNIESIELKYI